MTPEQYCHLIDSLHRETKKFGRVEANEIKTIKYPSFRIRARFGNFEVLTKHGITVTLYNYTDTLYHRCTLEDASFCSDSAPVQYFRLNQSKGLRGIDFAVVQKNTGVIHEENDIEHLSLDEIEAKAFQYSLINGNEDEFTMACMVCSGLYTLPVNAVSIKLSSHLGSTEKTLLQLLEDL